MSAALFVAVLTGGGCKESETPTPSQNQPALKFLSGENIDVPYEGGSFTLTYELTGQRDDGAVTAAADAGWITVTDYSAPGKVEFTVSLNETFDARTGKVTVTYTYNGGETVSASVAVSQPPHYDIDFEAEKLTGYYYGQQFSPGYGDYWFFFSDKGFAPDDTGLPEATYFHVDLYAELAPVPYDGGIPVGFYTLDASQTYPQGTFSSDMSYYYITDGEAEVTERHYFTEGTLSVEKDGSDYVLELRVTFDDGKKARAKYKGKIGLIDDSDDTPEIYTTLTGDHEADLSGCIGTAQFYADYYEVGASNWTVNIDPGTYPGDGFTFDLNCSGAFDEGIPSGRYEVADNYAAGTIYPGYMQYGYLYGTWWIGYATADDMTEYAPAISGGIDVTRNSDGTYTFGADFYDDAPVPNHVTGIWTGTMIMENKRPSPVPEAWYPAWEQTVTAKRQGDMRRSHPTER